MRTCLFTLILLLSFTLPAFATKMNFQGSINTLRHDVANPANNFLILNGIQSAGSCATSGDLVLIRITESN